jgi:5-methylcytosine-specific restriction protein B
MKYILSSFWLLEADWRGGKEHTERFITEGIWFNLHSNKASEFNKIKEGDFVAIKSSVTKELDNSEFQSSLKIEALGIVNKNFIDGRRIEVDWKRELFEIEGLVKAESLSKISDKNEIDLIFGKYKEEKEKISKLNLVTIPEKIEKIEINTPSDIIYSRKEKEEKVISPKIFESPKVVDKTTKNIPLNQIFYGLSGTGKTHNTMLSALEIIDGFFPENLEVARKKFNYYKDIGQISMIAFHESYKYEDFIENISNNISEKNKSITENKIKNGVFKEITSIARAEIESFPNKIDFSKDNNKIKFFKISLGLSAKEKDNNTINFCFENDCIILDALGGIDYSILENTEDWEKAQDEIRQAYLYEGQNPDQIRLGIQSIYYFKNLMKKNDIVFVSNNNEQIIGIAQVKSMYEFRDIAGVRYYHFRKVDWIIKDCNIPVSKFYRKEFSEQPIYELSKKNIIIENLISFISKDENRIRNYVMIIDEINKGNIYKIFGEVITLIETSKRLGKIEGLKIKLPYSGDYFGIPDNLYIIGTMNSSDKTEILDQTLRRRFDFIKLEINYDLLNFKIDGIDISKLLQIINKRIIFLSSEYNLVGHSYFMNLIDNPTFEQLTQIFKNKIIPFLMDVFEEDYEKIALVLGDANKKPKDEKFVIKNEINIKEIFGKNYKSKIKKDSFSIFIPQKPVSYIKIYHLI